MTYKIYNNLKSIRSRYKYSQSQMAGFLGISRQSYMLKENGNQEFTQSEIEKLKVLFNLSYESIFFTEIAHNSCTA